MVKLKNEKYGIDINGSNLYIACRTCDGGRERISNLFESNPDDLNKGLIEPETDLYFSVSERNAVIKRVKIKDNGLLDPDKLAQFELSGSLMNDFGKYYLESHPLNIKSARLAIAYNKNFIDEKIAVLSRHLNRPAGFKLRSLALANGYKKYCLQEGGALIGLIDINSSQASYCFLYEGQPVLLGMVKSDDNLNTAFQLDLIATIQFKLASIENGIGSLPVSQLVLTGCSVSEKLAGEIEAVSGIKTILPSFRREHFAEEIFDDAGKYAVSFGLTIENE